MPELPEVEVVRRGVDGWVSGRTIASVTVLHPRAVRRHITGPDDFAARLAGRKVLGAERRGKYLWLPVGDPDAHADELPAEALLAHLGMSGQLLVGKPDSPFEKHLRVRMTFTDGGLDLRFVDQRTFGHLMVTNLVPDAFAATAPGAFARVPEPILHIARDPLEQAFDDEAFYRALRRRRTGIKRALLDQSLISGVGNIYADEALWRARLHWARPTETLTRAEVTRVLLGVREVMGAALAAGGTSFDSLYVDVNGDSGYFDRSLHVYGRGDRPCDRCGTPIRRDAFMNRSSFSCPRCQPWPRRARV
ncbi:bifunctional DNA-formamidopyrimidine glycosylase/DNA-(apurinic or apyrimidinic site) lyase [Actinomadura alba]|uniref:Formamidopyrimidine-DNA glycosylase n=1 Tax=Actinomadura alba TaxID=406431 RepID=A0ABR7LHP6_9ACTN|nr:bifunctional DNA-formamidopyrimidine glycosylase/DNA-(apurinic or apyrimidinic site) lyase [Actinomadura alba]MBC6464331.1 bifunctional DNA-formamidopyrimidine glycosylase/DNA-(apurinic or apyrimidinic site) lyase [Actinomadura alba]